jgi:hypothetical protein
MPMTGQLHASAALLSHYTRGWVGRRTGLKDVEGIETRFRCRELNPGRSACSPSLSRCKKRIAPPQAYFTHYKFPLRIPSLSYEEKKYAVGQYY